MPTKKVLVVTNVYVKCIIRFSLHSKERKRKRKGGKREKLLLSNDRILGFVI